MRLLEDCFDAVAHFYFFFRISHQPAFDDHAFVQNNVDVINRRLVFESRVARHANQRESVHFARAFGLDPVQLAETIDAGHAWKKLQLAAAFAFLQQEFAVRGAFPKWLIDFIYFRPTFLWHPCFSHYFLLSITSAAVLPLLRPYFSQPMPVTK